MPFFLVPILVIGALCLILFTLDLARRVKKMDAQFVEFRKQTYKVIAAHKEQIELLRGPDKAD